MLSLICMLHGTLMDNADVAPAQPRHFTDVEAAFEAQGLKDRISMLQLVHGGPPIDVPFDGGDFPTIGHMSPEAVKAARGLIGTRDWSACPARFATPCSWSITGSPQRRSAAKGLSAFTAKR